ncbi:MAG: hypothetical protein OEV36_13490, partial [Myxococcales bacterium]|nr:hypothetical protein [Myxococcales bacterium]
MTKPPGKVTEGAGASYNGRMIARVGKPSRFGARMPHPPNNDDETPLNAVGRVLDSRWMMAFAVLAV